AGSLSLAGNRLIGQTARAHVFVQNPATDVPVGHLLSHHAPSFLLNKRQRFAFLLLSGVKAVASPWPFLPPSPPPTSLG
ncbi:hypothetical protein ACLOJK_003715, partial [Asimina triloba]